MIAKHKIRAWLITYESAHNRLIVSNQPSVISNQQQKAESYVLTAWG